MQQFIHELLKEVQQHLSCKVSASGTKKTLFSLSSALLEDNTHRYLAVENIRTRQPFGIQKKKFRKKVK